MNFIFSRGHNTYAIPNKIPSTLSYRSEQTKELPYLVSHFTMWSFVSGCANRALWCAHGIIGPTDNSKSKVLGGRIQRLQQDPSDTSHPASSVDERIQVLADGIKEGKFRNIVVLTGAGISCAAGIPDFRSRTGMYERSTKFDLRL
jgi:hypothetical protein